MSNSHGYKIEFKSRFAASKGRQDQFDYRILQMLQSPVKDIENRRRAAIKTRETFPQRHAQHVV